MTSTQQRKTYLIRTECGNKVDGFRTVEEFGFLDLEEAKECFKEMCKDLGDGFVNLYLEDDTDESRPKTLEMKEWDGDETALIAKQEKEERKLEWHQDKEWELRQLTKAKLLDYCRANKIKGYSKYNKRELKAYILNWLEENITKLIDGE